MKCFLRFLLLAVALTFGFEAMAQSHKWQHLHKVNKRETIFGLAKEYGVTIQQLIDANPEMKQEGYELKKGDLILVPFAKGKDSKKNESCTESTINRTAAKQTVQGKGIRIGIMLPLHNLDGDGKRMVEYYRGILLALEQLKSEGITTDVHAWNVPKDGDIRTTLMDKNAENLDIIFGPLYSFQVKPLEDFCRARGTKLVIPFSVEGVNLAQTPDVFQVYQPEMQLNERAIACFLERFQSTHHIIFINCNDLHSRVGAFTSGLRKQLEVMNVKYDLTNLNSPIYDFAKHFHTARPNVVVLNTEKSPQMNRVFEKMDSLKRIRPGAAIVTYGYTQWFMYQDHALQNFFKYNVYIPTTYYYNKVANRTEAFEKLYKETYGEPMEKTNIPRMALVGYDQAEFFVRGLKNSGQSFRGMNSEVKYKPLQTRYNFEQVGQGGYRNNHFQLIHFKSDQTIDNLIY